MQKSWKTNFTSLLVKWSCVLLPCRVTQHLWCAFQVTMENQPSYNRSNREAGPVGKDTRCQVWYTPGTLALGGREGRTLKPSRQPYWNGECQFSERLKILRWKEIEDTNVNLWLHTLMCRCMHPFIYTHLLQNRGKEGEGEREGENHFSISLVAMWIKERNRERETAMEKEDGNKKGRERRMEVLPV